MNALRTLNGLDKERRCSTEGTAAAALVEKQQAAVAVAERVIEELGGVRNATKP